MTIETARLILSRPVPRDIPMLYEFLGDVAAMRHTHHDASLQACRRRVLVHEWRRRRNGCAPWTVRSKADGAITGWGGLYDDPFDPGWGIEVAYFFRPSCWGRGYASELVRACTDVADRVLELPHVSAFTHPDNAASRRVLENAGFALVRFVPEMDRLLFRRERSHYSA